MKLTDECLACLADSKDIYAFRLLCDALHMTFVCDEVTDFYIRTGKDGERHVYVKTDNANLKLYDNRGDLFVALRNVAVNICPNVSFRNEEYIYNK